MPSARTLQAALCAGALGLAGCATTRWPPPPGSCIEARHSGGKGGRWHYTVRGRERTRADIEQLVDDSPLAHRRVRSSAQLGIAGLVTTAAGTPFAVGGLSSAGMVGRPELALISLVGVGLFAAGTTIIIVADDPFRRAVVAYNADAARSGKCQGPPEEWIPAPIPPLVVPGDRGELPRYNPPPLAP
jgi:hypothetical protein